MRYDISKPTAPTMPNLGRGTECIKILLSQASKDMYEPLVPMFFPILGAHISGAEFQYPDYRWKELCGQMANLVAQSGDNKGQLTTLAKAICRDFSQHDEAEMKKLIEWQKQKQTKGANRDKPARPDVAFFFPPSDTTNPAFLQNAMALEAQGGRSQYFNLPEVEMADRLCGSHRMVSVLLRNVYDCDRAGALRATADGVTGNPTLRVCITISSNPTSTRQFYKRELLNGTFGRMVFSYKPRTSRSGRIPRQGRYTDEFYQKLDEYLARLDLCKGRFIIKPLNKLTDRLAERLGLRVVRHKALCPFHDDHHALLSFSVRRNTFRCFVCGAHGGPIDLVMRCENKPFLEACRWLADENNVILTSESSRFQDSCSKCESKPFDASRYERFFLRPWLSDEARRFLFQERRLDPRVVRWCRLTSFRDRHGTSWLQIPYYDREGQLVGIQNRNLASSSKVQDSGDLKHETCNLKPSAPRFRFPQGSECDIYNLPVLRLLRPGDELYITEGCSDCWAMLSAGHKAIAIPSATLLKKKDAEQLSVLSSQLSVQFHMYPDRDEPGERLFLQLKEVLPSIEHHQLPPDCKDFSDYYLKTRDKPPDFPS